MIMRTKFSYIRALGYVGSILGATATGAPANAQEVAATATVEDVLVTESPNSEQQAARELATVPGGTSIVKSKSYERGRAATAADALRNQPGVFAQSAGGNDAIKISVRGSGINRGTGFFRSGILFMYDGLPITGPGGTPFELFEPLGLNYIEILRGPNAFNFGALALGGAINYVTNTGYTASPIQSRQELGSFGYAKGQVSSGLVSGPFDYFLSGTASIRTGFQEFSNSNTVRFAGNIGYTTPDFESRMYLRYGNTWFQQPGLLTRAQIDQNPRQANPVNLATHTTRLQPGSYWLANKTTFKLDGASALELAGVFHNYPIDIGGATRSIWWYGDLTGSLRYTREDDLVGHRSRSLLYLRTTSHLYGAWNSIQNAVGAANFNQIQKIVNTRGSADNVAVLSNDFEFSPGFWLTSGLQLINTRRNSDITFPVSNNFSQNSNYLAPRFGLLYDANPDTQVFMSISKSVEPESSWSFAGGSNVGQLYNLQLQNQTAWTGELGTRARMGIFQGSVSYYYSAVRNELLSVQIAPNTFVEANATPTTHQGVEVGLDTLLWQENNGDAIAPGQRVVWEQSYSWNDFHYVDDPRFGSNQLPGIPESYYQGRLSYYHPSGFYASVESQAASSYPVDYANTFYTRPYVIFGARVGYLAPDQKFEAFLDFRNITNKHYAVSVSPAFNDAGRDVARSNPGDGFGVYTGVNYQF
jgi:iron complex outermembrane receptor protein